MHRKASAGLFALAALLFLLPWVEVTCAGQKVASISGIQMVTGFDVATSTLTGAPTGDSARREVLAAIALGITVMGSIAYFMRAKTGALVRSILGIAGIAALIGLKLKIDNDAVREGLQARYLLGFWLTTVSLLAASLLSLLGIRLGLSHQEHAGGNSEADSQN